MVLQGKDQNQLQMNEVQKHPVLAFHSHEFEQEHWSLHSAQAYSYITFLRMDFFHGGFLYAYVNDASPRMLCDISHTCKVFRQCVFLCDISDGDFLQMPCDISHTC